MTTLAFTQHYSPQSLSWDGAAALVAVLGSLLGALFVALIALALGACLLGILALVSVIPPTFWLGLALTGVFALATMPRKAVRA